MNKFLKKFVSGFLALTTAITALNTPFLSDTASAATIETGDGVSGTCSYFQYTYDFSGTGLTPIFGQIPKLSADGQVAYCIDCLSNSGSGGNVSNYLVGSDVDVNGSLSLALVYSILQRIFNYCSTATGYLCYSIHSGFVFPHVAFLFAT